MSRAPPTPSMADEPRVRVDRPMHETDLKNCIYCGFDWPVTEFSLEHIWPDALGGDFLPALFKTRNVCKRCNSLAGRFVDGAFLKSWFGQAERATGNQEYLDLDINSNSITSLSYMGPIADGPQESDKMYEMWLGPCGIHIIHVWDRVENGELWDIYAGGDPVARKKNPGRVYISLTTINTQWIALALRSIKAQFKAAERFIVNAQLPDEWRHLAKPINGSEPDQTNDLKVVKFVQDASRNGDFVGHNIKITRYLDHRFLTKIALGIGFQIFGTKFLSTEYASCLRTAMREANPEKRGEMPVRGSGFFDSVAGDQLKAMAFPGGWVIHMRVVADCLALMIITPSGRRMMIAISNTPELWNNAEFDQYKEGVFYVVVPPLGAATGPLSMPEYLNHMLKNKAHPSLAEFESRRVSKSSLPPCR